MHVIFVRLQKSHYCKSMHNWGEGHMTREGGIHVIPNRNGYLWSDTPVGGQTSTLLDPYFYFAFSFSLIPQTHTHTIISKTMATCFFTWQTNWEDDFTKITARPPKYQNTCTVDWTTTCMGTLTIHLCPLYLLSTLYITHEITGPYHSSNSWFTQNTKILKIPRSTVLCVSHICYVSYVYTQCTKVA